MQCFFCIMSVSFYLFMMILVCIKYISCMMIHYVNYWWWTNNTLINGRNECLLKLNDSRIWKKDSLQEMFDFWNQIYSSKINHHQINKNYEFHIPKDFFTSFHILITNELMLVKVKDICYKRYQNNEISELRIFISEYFHTFHVYNWENERKNNY